MSHEAPPISYRLGNDLAVEAVIDVYRSSTLAGRPLDDRHAMSRMLAAANLVVSAWAGDLLVGVARSLTDHTFCTYLSDLAVRLEYQRQGIGKQLIRRTQKSGMPATVFLIAAPSALPYYEHLGLAAESGWSLGPLRRLP
jgi:GNAT superfamily N-acetyltransferase